jgi:hypothetical protein
LTIDTNVEDPAPQITRRLSVLTDRTGVLEQLELMLKRAEAANRDWQISEGEHRLMTELAGAFGLELPTSAFRTSKGAVAFLRLARAAFSKST